MVFEDLQFQDVQWTVWKLFVGDEINFIEELDR